MSLIDEVIDEPLGGAHHDPAAVAKRIKETCLRFVKSVEGLSPETLLQRRYERFRRIGVFTTLETLPAPTSPNHA